MGGLFHYTCPLVLYYERTLIFLKRYSLFPKELRPVPKSWAATTGDLSWFRQHESGGHFAAFEKPAEMKQDLEDFLRHVTEEKGIVFGD